MVESPDRQAHSPTGQAESEVPKPMQDARAGENTPRETKIPKTGQVP